MFSAGSSSPATATATASSDNMRPSTHVPPPEYPSAIPADAQVVVALPVESYPEWTTDHRRFNGKLRCFPELVSLPDPQKYPAYYAAAADTIWLTNMRLQAHAPYNPDALPKADMDEMCKKWRAKHPDENAFPFPPDRRTLLVKAKEVHPFEGGDRRWSRACRLYEKFAAAQKQVYLGKSGADIEKTYEYTVTDDLYTDFFLRYLAWREHVLPGGEDIQPSRQQLQDFFGEPVVKASGATPANVQQAFPGAREARMKDQNGLHPDERVESVYTPKTIPTHHEIRGKVEEALETHGPMPPSEILEHLYPFGFGHEDSITRVVRRIAEPTVNGEGLGLAVMPAPSASRIREELSTINGRRDTEIHQWAGSHVLSSEDLMAPLTQVAYFDTDLRWYARFLDASGQPIQDPPSDPDVTDPTGPIANTENKRLRAEARMGHMHATAPADLSELLQNIAVWDPVQQRYIQKPEATRSGNPTLPPRFIEARPPFLASSIGGSASALLGDLPSSLLDTGSSSSPPPPPPTGDKRKRSVDDDGAEKEALETKHQCAEDQVEGEDEDQAEDQVEGEEGGLTELDHSSETELQFSDDLDNEVSEIREEVDFVVDNGEEVEAELQLSEDEDNKEYEIREEVDFVVDNGDESEPQHDDKAETESVPDTEPGDGDQLEEAQSIDTPGASSPLPPSQRQAQALHRRRRSRAGWRARCQAFTGRRRCRERRRALPWRRYLWTVAQVEDDSEIEEMTSGDSPTPAPRPPPTSEPKGKRSTDDEEDGHEEPNSKRQHTEDLVSDKTPSSPPPPPPPSSGGKRKRSADDDDEAEQDGAPDHKRQHTEEEPEKEPEQEAEAEAESEDEVEEMVMVQCSGTTKKGPRCLRKKLLPVGQEHFCKAHE